MYCVMQPQNEEYFFYWCGTNSFTTNQRPPCLYNSEKCKQDTFWVLYCVGW